MNLFRICNFPNLLCIKIFFPWISLALMLTTESYLQAKYVSLYANVTLYIGNNICVNYFFNLWTPLHREVKTNHTVDSNTAKFSNKNSFEKPFIKVGKLRYIWTWGIFKHHKISTASNFYISTGSSASIVMSIVLEATGWPKPSFGCS